MINHSDRNYEELEGKEIVFVNDIGVALKAKVVNIDYDIGITIVADQVITTADWHGKCTIECNVLRGVGDELICLNGKYSKNNTSEYYKQRFYVTVAMIRKGKISYAMIDKVDAALRGFDLLLGNTTALQCAYK